MANTRRNRRASRASRKDRKDRKNRRNTRRNRRSSRRNRRNTRRNNMMGGRRRKASGLRIASRVANPVRALGRGAGKTVSTAGKATIKLFDDLISGANKTVGAAAGAVNSTVGAIFKTRRNRSNRRH